MEEIVKYDKINVILEIILMWGKTLMDFKKRYFRTMSVILLIAMVLLSCSTEEIQPETQVSERVQEQLPKPSRPREQSQIKVQESPEDVDEEATIDTGEWEKGFATEEEPVLSYLAGLRDNDFGRMEDSFLDKSKAVDISSQYVYLCGIDLIPGLDSDGYVRLSESKDVEKFSEQLNGMIEATDFQSMEFLGFVPPYYFSDSYSTDVYQDNLKRIAKENGGSELYNRVAAVAINDMKYLLFFDVIKADDRYYIFQLGGILPTLSVAEPEEMGTFRMDEEVEEVLELILSENTDIPRLPELKDAVEQEQVESDGFDTPQEAAAAYLEGLKTGDTKRMLRTFCVESYARNFDMQAYMEYMQAYMFLHQDVKVPAINDFTKAMISCERREQLKEDMLAQGNTLYLWNCYFNDIEPDQGGTSFGWAELSKEVALDSIEIVGFILPEELIETRLFEKGKEISGRRSRFYGADQIQDCMVVFTCGGGTYCLFMEEVQYNSRWYNSSFGNNTSMSLDVYADSMGTVPLEWLGEPAEVEKFIVK